MGLGFQPKWRLEDIPKVPKVNNIYVVFTISQNKIKLCSIYQFYQYLNAYVNGLIVAFCFLRIE